MSIAQDLVAKLCGITEVSDGGPRKQLHELVADISGEVNIIGRNIDMGIDKGIITKSCHTIIEDVKQILEVIKGNK